MYGIDLFSGIGGISVALEDISKHVAFCEINDFCVSVLKKRFIDNVPEGEPKPAIFRDVRITNFEEEVEPHIPHRPHIIYGGFPCQDISCAGKGSGIEKKETSRSGLFYKAMQWVDHFRPTFVFLENVPAIRTRGLDVVLEEMMNRGYTCRWGCLHASDVGAKHGRRRWFLLACNRFNRDDEPRSAWAAENLRVFRTETFQNAGVLPVVLSSSLPTELLEQTKNIQSALGNSVVPQQVREAFARVCGFPSEGVMTDMVARTEDIWDLLVTTFLTGCYIQEINCRSRTFSDIRRDIPLFGVAKLDGTVISSQAWTYDQSNGFLWPTPTHSLRVSCGHTRMVRKLVLDMVLTWEEGYIYNYKMCPCVARDGLEEWSDSKLPQHVHIHEIVKSEEFTRRGFVRNPLFQCRLMGYPVWWFE